MASEFSPEYWITYGFCGCYVRYFPATQFTQTIYPDGASVPAAPSDTDYYRAMAARLGYGGDLAACCREHEILHTFLAEAQGLPDSPLMWAIAHGAEETIPLWHREREETVVMEFQRYLNGEEFQNLELPPQLFGLRRAALQMLRQEATAEEEQERA